MQQGIDKSFIQMGVEFGKTNKTFINQFKTNTAIFAAFKSHEEQTQISKQILDENGKLRSFYNFKKAVKPIIGDYNVNYLKTEYDTVVRSARMAANWKKFEEKKDIFPNIEYMLSRANEKRPEHLEFVGTIRPIDDSWWNTHTPPIDWGCQCWIRQTRADVTPVPQDEIEVPEIFQNNPGKTAEPFVIKKTSYVKNAKDITYQEVEEFVNSNQYYYTKEYEGKNGGLLEVSNHADKTPNNIVIGKILADKGYKVKLLPEIHPNNKTLRKELLPGVFENKNPDAMINDEIFEFKSLTSNSYNALSKAIKKAGHQANNIVVNYNNIDESIIIRALRGRLLINKSIKKIILINGDTLRIMTREDILK